MFNQYDDLLTVEELSEALSIGKNMSYKLLNSGEIKAFRAGRTWKIPKIYLEDYILQNCKSKNK